MLHRSFLADICNLFRNRFVFIVCILGGIGLRINIWKTLVSNLLRRLAVPTLVSVQFVLGLLLLLLFFDLFVFALFSLFLLGYISFYLILAVLLECCGIALFHGLRAFQAFVLGAPQRRLRLAILAHLDIVSGFLITFVVVSWTLLVLAYVVLDQYAREQLLLFCSVAHLLVPKLITSLLGELLALILQGILVRGWSLSVVLARCRIVLGLVVQLRVLIQLLFFAFFLVALLEGGVPGIGVLSALVALRGRGVTLIVWPTDREIFLCLQFGPFVLDLLQELLFMVVLILLVGLETEAARVCCLIFHLGRLLPRFDRRLLTRRPLCYRSVE